MKKFKINDEVHHMELNKPVVSVIKSIITIEGEVEFGYKKFKSEPGEQKTIFSLGYATFLEEKDFFKNIDDLKNSLFN